MLNSQGGVCMKVYSPENIRNIALLGHSSSGKTTLTEAALFLSGAITRQGIVDDGNTVSDFAQEEIERGVSIGTTSIPVEYEDIKYNFLDTPGYFDFIGEMYGAKRASESTVLIIDATSGIEVGTEKSWNNLEKYNTPRIIFLNKMDKDDIKYDELIDEIRSRFGEKVMPFSLPTFDENGKFNGYVAITNGKQYLVENRKTTEVELEDKYKDDLESLKDQIYEKIAETDERLLDKYFNGEEFTAEEIKTGIKGSIAAGDLVPLAMGSASKNYNIDRLLGFIKDYMPSPMDVENPVGKNGDEEITRGKELSEPFSAVVFKTIVDPYMGKLSLFRVISGSLEESNELYNATKDKLERSGGIFVLRGKEQIKVPRLTVGDIGATSRLASTETGDTLCDEENVIIYETIEYPKPTLFSCITTKSRDDEDKLAMAFRKLREEDPTFTFERNEETKELVIGGQGNMQIRGLIDKLKNKFDIEVELKVPKVAYRETIKGKSDVQGRHKKQSGGAGQFGDVHIRFEPCDEEFIFEEEVFGGSVPRNYFPAVEKGLVESKLEGVLAGYPVVNFKATLYDGSHHPVDSNEMAFKIAATLAFRKGMEEAKPILLEPIMNLRIVIPDEYMGDVMGDMNKRRGRIMGMEQDSEGNQILSAEAPHSELFEYAIDLKAMTQSRGDFQMEFLRYEEVPKDISDKIIAEKNSKK